jgi:hypothetical protein
MTRAQLIKKVREWGPRVREYEETTQRNVLLVEKLQATESELKKMAVAYNRERKGNDDLLMQLLEKMKECEANRRPLCAKCSAKKYESK